MSTIKIIPLGGVRENGKNMYVAEVGEDIFILDCGLKYPENELLGIDVVIPDFNTWTCRCDRGTSLLVVKNFCTSIRDRVDDRVSKIECQS